MRSRPLAIDLFSGAGGMSLGFEQAGFDVALAVDADGHHVAVHERNFPDCAVLCRSVVGLSAADVWASIGGEKEIDLVFGGPPCQGFSNMGLRDAADPRNTLVDEFARIVAEIGPKAFVMENVPGMLSGSTKAILDRTVRFLSEAGYRIPEPQILHASNFGVPQKRRRLFVIGIRSDVADGVAHPHGISAKQPPRPTVAEAIADLPEVENYPELLESNSVRYDKKPRTQYAKVARGVAADESDFSHPRLWDAKTCTGCARVLHTDKAATLYAATPPGSTVPGHKLPRLHPDGICPTLRAGSDSTHGSYTAPRPIHPFKPRCITAREAARLHGYPDWFAFYPQKWHAYRQIGNSVCPPVARAVGREIMRALGQKPRKPKRVIALNSEYALPEDRPRTLRRIPHRVNYPPVIQYLFSKAYDVTSGCLQHSGFTFEDVEEAIAATNVNLSWSRSDTFVSEIARSRNVRQILAPCHKYGYSIRALSNGTCIGEFVPVGEPGAVEDKQLIVVKSGEVSHAHRLRSLFSIDVTKQQNIPDALQERDIRNSLWPGKKVEVLVSPLTSSNGSGFVARYKLVNGRKRHAKGLLVVALPRALPTKAKLYKLATEAEVAEVVILSAITRRHILASRFDNCLNAPVEANRRIFEVASEFGMGFSAGHSSD